VNLAPHQEEALALVNLWDRVIAVKGKAIHLADIRIMEVEADMVQTSGLVDMEETPMATIRETTMATLMAQVDTVAVDMEVA
jgi:hypothetical protein